MLELRFVDAWPLIHKAPNLWYPPSLLPSITLALLCLPAYDDMDRRAVIRMSLTLNSQFSTVDHIRRDERHVSGPCECG